MKYFKMANAIDAEFAKKEAILSLGELIDAIEELKGTETIEAVNECLKSLKKLVRTANKWQL